MEDQKVEVSQEQKEERLVEQYPRLKAIWIMRQSILETMEQHNRDHDFYIEANETLNDAEAGIWKYINGDTDNY